MKSVYKIGGMPTSKGNVKKAISVLNLAKARAIHKFRQHIEVEARVYFSNWLMRGLLNPTLGTHKYFV